MVKLKIYVYPHAKGHVHDDIPVYENTVPFSKRGLYDYCELVGPEEAEYFYMGQYSVERDRDFSVNNFRYFKGREHLHIIDMEGDGGLPIPKDLYNCIVTVNGPLMEEAILIHKLVVRPTFSTLLVDIARNKNEEFKPLINRGLGFKGFINCNTRLQMFRALSSQSVIQVSLEHNPSWSGPSKISSEIQSTYIEKLKKYSFSLCPRGAGIDSVRVWESCYYGRIPIIITDKPYAQVGYPIADISFIREIVWDGSDYGRLVNELQKIISVSDEVILKDQKKAREYFETNIRIIVTNPTKYALNLLGITNV